MKRDHGRQTKASIDTSLGNLDIYRINNIAAGYIYMYVCWFQLINKIKLLKTEIK